MRHLLLAALLVAMTGCGSDTKPEEQPTTPAETAAQEDQPTTPAEDYPRLTAVRVDSNDLETSTGSIGIVNPTAVNIHFEQLNWNDPESKPRLTVELAWDTALTVELSPDSTEDLPEFVALWRQPVSKPTSEQLQGSGAAAAVIWRSKPFKDVEKALALLQSFTKPDGNIGSKIEWSNEKVDFVRSAPD